MTEENNAPRVLARINDTMSGGRRAAEPQEGEKVYAFEHDSIARFKVGPFEFRDNICRIPESQVDRFLLLWQGLNPADRHAISALKEEKNTLTLQEFRGIRGAVSTADIKDKTQDAAPKQADAPSQVTDAAAISAGPTGGLKIPNLSGNK